MAEFLKTFIEGEDILASDANSNNQYLLSKLSDNAAQVQSYVEGEVASIQSNVASVQATLQNNINEFETRISSRPYIIETVENGNNVVILWSNGLCEQWGLIGLSQDQDKAITLHRPYKNTSYVVNCIMNAGQNGLSRGSFSVRNLTTSNFVVCNGQDISGSCHWYTKGFVTIEEVE